jgi:hypothetical protein
MHVHLTVSITRVPMTTSLNICSGSWCWFVRVYDAKTMDATPLARVRLPRRVPYGFHTVFVPQSDIKAQASSNAATQQPPPPGLEILTRAGTL